MGRNRNASVKQYVVDFIFLQVKKVFIDCIDNIYLVNSGVLFPWRLDYNKQRRVGFV